jgi:hypothetical protein
MNKELYGIVGVIVGSLLGTMSTVILDRYNRSKKLYVDATKAGFSIPSGTYDPLVGYLSIYIYNDSSLPKTFLLESLKLVNENVIFSVKRRGERDLATGIVHQIAPSNGIHFSFEVDVHPEMDFDVPDVEGKVATLTYRSGKRSESISIALFYYNEY